MLAYRTNVCRPKNLRPGVACVIDLQCRSGSCVGGTCAGSALGTVCNAIEDCAEPNFCVTNAGTGVKECTAALVADGAACTTNSDCESGVCDKSGSVCIPEFSKAGGANCTSNDECSSHKCGSNGVYSVCLQSYLERGEGEECPDGDLNCKTGHVCVGSDTIGTTRVCRNVVNKLCASSSVCGNGVCTCAGSENKCFARRFSPIACDTHLVKAQRLGSNIPTSSSTTFPTAGFALPWDAYTAAGGNAAAFAQAMADLYCCYYNAGESGLVNIEQTLAAYKLECKSSGNVFAAISESSAEPRRCTPVDRYKENEVGSGVRGTPVSSIIRSAAATVAPKAVATAAAVVVAVVLALLA
ncbi:uncharacterized protein AMSG_08198 [Thecamonas trahens ATCC 50062]|uniref:Dickkopf N-terminal cysteine-rich domain-containing protein n=1 Tax=Thecamonas trahens ATCC 50062 TaxID=461836 RepID=A0A0L0DI22_THETB|nr:hypothetical protein AMSG_08198 [Thecamonas trahens ATCC 50062]KNC51952.1 hypothetical protein AMSG_08198 [Thecamonas trahens ATCC 50062]|eukprot:XP_013755541.1 hypothetical protein AMSG_08198 [Thecamonas trahens ATCC 50062]